MARAKQAPKRNVAASKDAAAAAEPAAAAAAASPAGAKKPRISLKIKRGSLGVAPATRNKGKRSSLTTIKRAVRREQKRSGMGKMAIPRAPLVRLIREIDQQVSHEMVEKQRTINASVKGAVAGLTGAQPPAALTDMVCGVEPSHRFTVKALAALHEACESHLVLALTRGDVITQAMRKQTLSPLHMRTARILGQLIQF